MFVLYCNVCNYLKDGSSDYKIYESIAEKNHSRKKNTHTIDNVKKLITVINYPKLLYIENDPFFANFSISCDFLPLSLKTTVYAIQLRTKIQPQFIVQPTTLTGSSQIKFDDGQNVGRHSINRIISFHTRYSLPMHILVPTLITLC